MMADLTLRQQSILGIVIRTYIATAQPVSSKALLELSGLEFSSATIRNEMAVLEDLGYLTHPHTSAGRIPTDKGYRYFVERLLGDVVLPLDERKTIRHQFHQARLEMGQWMQLAATVMARTSRGASLITAPQIEQPILKHIELISTQPKLILLVLVLQGGVVRQQMIALREPMDQVALSQTAAFLNAQYTGLNAVAIRSKSLELSDFEIEVMRIMVGLMSSESHHAADVVRDGLTGVLREPEFGNQSDARALVSAFESPVFLNGLIDAPVGTVQVVIGGEGRWRELSSCSMVLARYGTEGFATGLLGVLGPTRMPYDRAIGTVRYVAELMSTMVGEIYGE
ncbi:MAG: heat-inducible transcriptional repressor HrcA [Anaerolineae bacterium]|nr:heat-inducible transcriptional repressor HrcA [Anaerolineae bacterium]